MAKRKLLCSVCVGTELRDGIEDFFFFINIYGPEYSSPHFFTVYFVQPHVCHLPNDVLHAAKQAHRTVVIIQPLFVCRKEQR